MVSNSAASAFWYPGSSQSHELAQLGSGATEPQSNENPILWNARQNNISGSAMNNNISRNTRARIEGAWPSSSHLNISSNCFPDPKNNKAIAHPPPVPSWPHDQAENVKKCENPIGCRLFGVNLTNNSNNAAPQEKEIRGCTAGPSGSKESVPVVACEIKTSQNPNCSVSKNEQKQETLNAPPSNERQNKQASLPSTRTRTKVRDQQNFNILSHHLC